jgi:hypothetical protein
MKFRASKVRESAVLELLRLKSVKVKVSKARESAIQGFQG